MLFNSLEFIFLFLPTVIFITFFIIKQRNRNVFFLFLSSLFFYMYWKIEALPILLFSIIINYFFGNAIIKSQKKIILVCALVFNICLLLYYKYFVFLSNILGYKVEYAIILPLGISFFTFTQISYLVDCYHAKTVKTNFFHYGLFVTYFPHLIAGPVLHHADMIPQFNNKNLTQINTENFSKGLCLLVLGLSKKLLLADKIMPYVDPVFCNPDQLSFIDSWGGALAYTLQLYFDFSAYSDMAIGISKMINIDLPINFNSPYKSKSLIEFWSRWHISLSSFLKDYVYIPLGGNKKGQLMKYKNIILVMLISGIWHGAAVTFFIWGLYHAIFLLINHIYRDIKKAFFPLYTPNKLSIIASKILSLIIVIISWVFFRSESITTALKILSSMFLLNDYATIFTHSSDQYLWYLILLQGTIVLFLPNSQEIVNIKERITNNNKKNKFYPIFKPNTSWALLISILFYLSVLHINQKSEFLYFQF